MQEDLLSLGLMHDRRLEAAVKAGLVPSEDFFMSEIVTKEGNLRSARLLRRREAELLRLEGPGGFNDLMKFIFLCRGETFPHTKPQDNCRLSTMGDAYFVLCEYQDDENTTNKI